MREFSEGSGTPGNYSWVVEPWIRERPQHWGKRRTGEGTQMPVQSPKNLGLYAKKGPHLQRPSSQEIKF